MNQTKIEFIITINVKLNRLFKHKTPYSINNLEKLQIVNNSKKNYLIINEVKKIKLF